MTPNASTPEWVWVIVEKDKKNETLLALREESQGLNFIPAFLRQEDGQACLPRLAKHPGMTYEIEALRLTEAAKAAYAGQADLYILDGEGRILDRLAPALETQA